MTVSAVPRLVAYEGDGSTTLFAAPFQFFEISVYVDGELKTVGVDYTISQSGIGTTGDVVFLVAPAGGASVVLTSATLIQQLVDYVENDGFPAESHEQALDRLTMCIQDLSRTLSQGVRAAPDNPPLDPLDFANNPNKVLWVDENGVPILAPVQSTPIGALLDAAAEVAEDARDDAIAAKDAAESAASTAAEDAADDVASLLSGYVSDATNAKNAAQSAQSGAEAARLGSEAAETNSGVHATDADNARVASEAAQAAAEAAQAAAEDVLQDAEYLLSTGGLLLRANNFSDVADPLTARTNLGVGTGDSPELASLNLGHATDTTLTRVSAGKIAVEGDALIRASDTGTSGANKVLKLDGSGNLPALNATNLTGTANALVAGIGVGQTWQDVTGSRAMNTSYQNTTGKPIGVTIYGQLNNNVNKSNFALQVSVDNSTWVSAGIGSTQDGDNNVENLFSIVPNNYYYKYIRLSGSNSSHSLYYWAELR